MIGVPQIAPLVTNATFDGPGANEDFGLEQVTGDPADRYAFRTSPLRNVALQPAFMHNGAFTTLEDAIAHHLDAFASARAYDTATTGLDPDLMRAARAGRAGARPARRPARNSDRAHRRAVRRPRRVRPRRAPRSACAPGPATAARTGRGTERQADTHVRIPPLVEIGTRAPDVQGEGSCPAALSGRERAVAQLVDPFRGGIGP